MTPVRHADPGAAQQAPRPEHGKQVKTAALIQTIPAWEWLSSHRPAVHARVWFMGAEDPAFLSRVSRCGLQSQVPSLPRPGLLSEGRCRRLGKSVGLFPQRRPGVALPGQIR